MKYKHTIELQRATRLEDHVTEALAKLLYWLESPESYQSATCSSKDNFAITLEENMRRWNGLLGEILGTVDDASAMDLWNY